jgi:hypothetical protein
LIAASPLIAAVSRVPSGLAGPPDCTTKLTPNTLNANAIREIFHPVKLSYRGPAPVAEACPPQTNPCAPLNTPFHAVKSSSKAFLNARRWP